MTGTRCAERFVDQETTSREEHKKRKRKREEEIINGGKIQGNRGEIHHDTWEYTRVHACVHVYGGSVRDVRTIYGQLWDEQPEKENRKCLV